MTVCVAVMHILLNFSGWNIVNRIENERLPMPRHFSANYAEIV
jgi:hypothetical protein